MTFQQAAIVAIAGALIGALIGAAATFWLQRARPQVVLNSAILSSEYADSEDEVQPETNLLKLERTWYKLSALSKLPSLPSEKDYVQSLITTREQAVKARRAYRLTSMGLSNFQDSMNSGKFDVARNFFTDIDEEVFHALAGYVLYSGSNLSEIMELGQDPTQPQERIQVWKGTAEKPARIIIRTNLGSRNISFSISNSWSQVQWPTLEVLGIGLCRLLWRDNKSEFDFVIDVVEKVLQDQDEICAKMESAITSALSSFEEIVVQGIITNSGARALSALPRGKLFIDLKGYPFRMEKGEMVVVKNNVDVWLRFVEIENRRSTRGAITIAAGSSFTFLAVTEKKVRDCPDSSAVRQAFEGGTISSYLGLALVGLKKDTSVIYSPPRLFRNIQIDQKIPRK